MRKSFAVFGLGRFGEAVVRTLVAEHQDVLAGILRKSRSMN